MIRIFSSATGQLSVRELKASAVKAIHLKKNDRFADGGIVIAAGAEKNG